ncbi:MAG: glycine/betaine/sarcosine/D-proline family reductase selenoprotein B [Acidimicrobiia bacterium]|nr:glycine/betaine/sarcosine/D-proline family reductase selenoprotein B [Acidimicrobiia bacterium]
MDPYRYLPFLSRTVMRAWAEREQPPVHVSWTPLTRPLDRCRVALISTAGIALAGDEPFDEQAERDDPWRGDDGWRAIPATATAADVGIHHLHIDRTPAEEDLDVVLPSRRLAELAADGVIGEANHRHFSIMGYILDATGLVTVTAPELGAELAADDVDLALLVPV